MDAADDLPSWPKVVTWSAAFFALWVGSMAVVIRLSTGAWGGTQADPLWVGPVSAGAGLVAAIVITVLAYGARIWREDVTGQDDLNAIAAALYMQVAARGGPLAPQPRPIREILPAHFRHPFAVYEMRPGQYSVMRNGEAWGQPFETTDPDLAFVVCDTWAKEFKEDA